MAKQSLNFGTNANDGTGDALRTGGFKIQSNFDELYASGSFVKPADMNVANVNSAITTAQSTGATLTLPPGDYPLNGDLVTWNGVGTVGPSQGFTLTGAGKLHNYAAQFGGSAMGTVLRLSNGSQIDTNGARSLVLEDLAIFGSHDDALLDGENAFENGGGLRSVYIANQSTAPGATVVRTGAMFTSRTHHADIVGRIDYRNRYNSSIETPNLYNTVGFKFDGTGKGAGGIPVGWNLHGHETAVKLGLTRTDFNALSPNQRPRIANWALRESQASYCNKGVFCGAGCLSMVIIDQHWEFIGDYAAKIAHGAGTLVVHGGQSSGLPRGNGQHLRDGQFIAGDANAADSEFGHLIMEQHNLAFVGQAGVLVYGHGTGEVVLKECWGNANGGVFVAVDPTGGTPQIWINGFLGPAEEGLAEFSAGRFIRDVTPKTDYTRHTFNSDARWRARIENAGIYGEGIVLNGNLNLNEQKYAPVNCTVSSSRTVTLGDATPIGWSTTLNRTAGAISLVVPNGTALFHGGSQHTAAGGSTTLNLNTSGTYQLTRLDKGIWSCEGVAI